jgi:hypothetical protein
MRITRRQLRRLIRESYGPDVALPDRVSLDYQLGREDAESGVPPQDDDDDYMMAYNDILIDMGEEPVVPVSQVAGEPLDPDLLQYAHVGGRIREAEGSTKKYDDDSALKGGQSKLHDKLQKAIIDKSVEDREEHEEEDREEKNEGTVLDDMPDAWRQILGKCLGS